MNSGFLCASNPAPIQGFHTLFQPHKYRVETIPKPRMNSGSVTPWFDRGLDCLEVPRFFGLNTQLIIFMKHRIILCYGSTMTLKTTTKKGNEHIFSLSPNSPPPFQRYQQYCHNQYITNYRTIERHYSLYKRKTL